MKKIISYQCEWCDKTGSESNVILEHENQCTFNPHFKGCNTCVHYNEDFDDFLVFDFQEQICDADLDIYNYQKKGKCPKWKCLPELRIKINIEDF